MVGKTCAVCGKEVHRNTGAHFNGRLVHKRCEGKAKHVWYRLRRK